MKFKNLLVLVCTIMTISFMAPIWTAEAYTTTPASTVETPEESYGNISLTDMQKEEIKPILEQRVQQINQVMHDSSLTTEEKWAKADDIRKESRMAVDQYLTTEQKVKVDPLRVENDIQRGEFREQEKKVIGDNQRVKEDRKKLHEDRENDNKEAAKDDKDKIKEDRQQRSKDRQDRHQVHQEGKEERHDRRQINRE